MYFVSSEETPKKYAHPLSLSMKNILDTGNQQCYQSWLDELKKTWIIIYSRIRSQHVYLKIVLDLHQLVLLTYMRVKLHASTCIYGTFVKCNSIKNNFTLLKKKKNRIMSFNARSNFNSIQCNIVFFPPRLFRA